MRTSLLALLLSLAVAAPAAAGVRLYAGGLAVVGDPYGPPRLVDLRAGTVHGLFRDGTGFAIGAGYALKPPVQGRASFDARGATIRGRRVALLPLRSVAVRFRSGDATLSGTLMLPPGRGRRAAVAFVAGSGPTTRDYLPELQALLLHDGVAVLAYDKRGVGRSTGAFPGEQSTEATIDVLARDAAAAARLLAGRPEVDPARVGLAGHSQGGWVMPLAATREPAIRFLVAFSGPAVTTDENDLYQTLAGEGTQPQRLSNVALDAQVLAAGPGGVDPLPWLRALTVPSLWVYGSLDKHVPPRLSAQRLAAAGGDVAVAVLPGGNHALVRTRAGLTSEMLRSDRYAPGLFRRVGTWLRAHGVT